LPQCDGFRLGRESSGWGSGLRNKKTRLGRTKPGRPKRTRKKKKKRKTLGKQEPGASPRGPLAAGNGKRLETRRGHTAHREKKEHLVSTQSIGQNKIKGGVRKQKDSKGV